MIERRARSTRGKRQPVAKEELVPIFAKKASQRRPSLIAEYFRRHRPLTLFGLALLTVLVTVLAACLLETRMMEGISVWAKPPEFLLSAAICGLTFAWSYIQAERRLSMMMQRTAVVVWGQTGKPYGPCLYRRTSRGLKLPIAWPVIRVPETDFICTETQVHQRITFRQNSSRFQFKDF